MTSCRMVIALNTISCYQQATNLHTVVESFSVGFQGLEKYLLQYLYLALHISLQANR